ncbi:MAG: Asp23/Gls24 family envelope stress response protein [Clostridia bacterium]|nr:Asp23/Gls24 family envelope stress response protein [Clostridia bacterium]
MSDNYPSDVKLNENPNGTVSFATEVVATIAGLAATEVDGVASMISPSSGLADMFSRKSNRNLTKGVRIDLEDNRVSVDVTITVDYGSPIPDVARNIQENVKKAIETMSGLDVKNVDVHVTGISFEREQRANAELDEQHRKMLEKNAEVEAMPKSEVEEMPEAAEAADQTGVEAVTVETEAAWDEDEEAPEGFEDKEDDCAAGDADDDGFAEDATDEENEDSDASEADI